MKPSGRQLLPALLMLALAFAVRGADLPLPANSTLNTGGNALLRAGNSSEVLPADQAFTVNAFVEADGDIALVWEFAPRLYLYRKSLAATQADGTALALELPEGVVVTDEFFGDSEVYFEGFNARIPQSALKAAPGATLELQLTYQGCLQDVYCYPPLTKLVTLVLPD